MKIEIEIPEEVVPFMMRVVRYDQSTPSEFILRSVATMISGGYEGFECLCDGYGREGVDSEQDLRELLALSAAMQHIFEIDDGLQRILFDANTTLRLKEQVAAAEELVKESEAEHESARASLKTKREEVAAVLGMEFPQGANA